MTFGTSVSQFRPLSITSEWPSFRRFREHLPSANKGNTRWRIHEMPEPPLNYHWKFEIQTNGWREHLRSKNMKSPPPDEKQQSLCIGKIHEWPRMFLLEWGAIQLSVLRLENLPLAIRQTGDGFCRCVNPDSEYKQPRLPLLWRRVSGSSDKHVTRERVFAFAQPEVPVTNWDILLRNLPGLDAAPFPSLLSSPIRHPIVPV